MLLCPSLTAKSGNLLPGLRTRLGAVKKISSGWFPSGRPGCPSLTAKSGNLLPGLRTRLGAAGHFCDWFQLGSSVIACPGCTDHPRRPRSCTFIYLRTFFSRSFTTTSLRIAPSCIPTVWLTLSVQFVCSFFVTGPPAVVSRSTRHGRASIVVAGLLVTWVVLVPGRKTHMADMEQPPPIDNLHAYCMSH